MKKQKNIFFKLLIFSIILVFCLSTIQITAQKTDVRQDKNENFNMRTVKLDNNVIKKRMQDKNFETKSVDFSSFSNSDEQVLAAEEYVGRPIVSGNGNGNAVFFIEYQDPYDPDKREIAAAPSYDNGATWDFDKSGAFPQDGGYNTLPALDFESDMTVYGSWIAEDKPGITHMAKLDDISDPEAGDQWIYWTPDWSDNFEDIGPFYSTDVACYDGPLNEEPGVFWGIASWTGDLDDSEFGQFERGIFLNYFSDQYIFISWFPDINGVYNIVSDIDQSTGVIYWAYEVYNPSTDVNDLWIMYITMEDWFLEESSFSIWEVEGPAKNPSIIAEDGNLIVAYESLGDIVCLYSSDIENSIESSVIAESGDDELYPALSKIDSDTVCAFNKNNDLYIATSENEGETWTVKDDKINDVSGSLKDEYHCVDLFEYRVFWSDTRETIADVYSDSIYAAPNVPTITGSENGKVNRNYDFTVTATHPDGLDLLYFIDWGDGTNTGWIGPFESGESHTEQNSWSSKEEFVIRAKAKDAERGIESSWAEFSFSTPKSKIKNIFNIQDLIQDLMDYFPILKQIFFWW